MSNWMELDIWQYIHREPIPLVPRSFAAERPVVDKDEAGSMEKKKREGYF